MIKGGIIQKSTEGLEEGFTQLTAVPLEGYSFKYFLVEDNPVYDNPLITDKEWDVVFYIQMRTYLKNLVMMNMKDPALIPISIRRGFSLDDDVNEVDLKTRELATADVYTMVASSPSSFTGVQETDFYYSHKESSYTSSSGDKKALLKLADDIYEKYGEPKRGGTIKIINV